VSIATTAREIEFRTWIGALLATNGPKWTLLAWLRQAGEELIGCVPPTIRRQHGTVIWAELGSLFTVAGAIATFLATIFGAVRGGLEETAVSITASCGAIVWTEFR
jgi:uncharacterized membrane protein